MAAARSSRSSTRAAEATESCAPTRAASDASSSARSIACRRAEAAAAPNPRSMSTGRPSSPTRMLAARSARWASPLRWSRATSRQVRSSSSGSSASGASESSCTPATSFIASTIEPSGRGTTARSCGQATPAALGQHQQQRLVLDLAGQRRRAAGIAGVAEQGAAVPRGTAGRRRGCPRRTPSGTTTRRPGDAVELGASTDGPLAARVAAPRSRCRRGHAATAAGVGRRLGAPTTTRTADPTAPPTAKTRSSSGAPAVPASAIVAVNTATAMSDARRHAASSHG